jgi:hypothetical protein
MKKNVLAALAALVVVLAGCASVPVPSPEQNTLVAGKLVVNWNSTGAMSGANGKIKLGVKTYFQNSETKKVISVTTQKDGWFLTSKLQAGSYTVQKLFLERQQENTIYRATLNGPFFITIEDGIVNNIGTIQIDIGNSEYSYRVVDYDVVYFDFQEEFPDSEWNSYEWKNNSLFNKTAKIN